MIIYLLLADDHDDDDEFRNHTRTRPRSWLQSYEYQSISLQSLP